MTLSINTNMASMTAQASMNRTQDKMSTTINRLSTGLRITQAKDDAAGLAIAAGLEAKINGLNQGSRNGNDGISLLQTAENALDQSLNTLQRMSQLASQASSGTYSSSDRDNLNNEFVALLAELDNVANITEFNGVSLLNVANQADTLNPIITNAVTNIVADIQAQLAQAATDAGDGNAGQDARDAIVSQLAVFIDGGNAATGALTSIITNETQDVFGITVDLQTAISDTLVDFLTNVKAVTPAGPAGADAASVVTALGTLVTTERTNALTAALAVPTNLDPNSGDPQTISIYMGTGDPVELSLMDATATTLLGTNDPTVLNISSSSNATTALGVLETGITRITQSLSRLGADNSKLEAAVNRNASSVTQLEASRSRIVDADYAEESANLAKYQILQQAGASMLSRANSQPQIILQLLQQL